MKITEKKMTAVDIYISDFQLATFNNRWHTFTKIRDKKVFYKKIEVFFSIYLYIYERKKCKRELTVHLFCREKQCGVTWLRLRHGDLYLFMTYLRHISAVWFINVVQNS